MSEAGTLLAAAFARIAPVELCDTKATPKGGNHGAQARRQPWIASMDAVRS
jgi:hypothetical protein